METKRLIWNRKKIREDINTFYQNRFEEQEHEEGEKYDPIKGKIEIDESGYPAFIIVKIGNFEETWDTNLNAYLKNGKI